MTNRRFPPPWTVERLPGGFKVIDANGQSLAYFYARENDNDTGTAGVLTMDEARRLASNFAQLPELRPRLGVGVRLRPGALFAILSLPRRNSCHLTGHLSAYACFMQPKGDRTLDLYFGHRPRSGGPHRGLVRNKFRDYRGGGGGFIGETNRKLGKDYYIVREGANGKCSIQGRQLWGEPKGYGGWCAVREQGLCKGCT